MNSKPYRALILAVALLLPACMTASPSGPAYPKLSAGGSSAMDAVGTASRNNLTIVPEPLAQTLRYLPVAACTYTVQESGPSGPLPITNFTLSLRPVRARLLATFNAQGRISTALIDADGLLHDFNGRIFAGSGANSETFGQVADAMRHDNPTIQTVLNDFGIFLPRFSAPPHAVGSPVATLTGDRNEVWATLLYRGRTELNGRIGAVIDIMRQAKDGEPLTIGFSVVDRERGIPLLLILQAGHTVRAELTSCS